LRQDGQFGDIVGQSPALAKVLDQIKTVAATDATVLICGESGTGKELVVRAIHELGPRAHKPLVRVNCAAIPKDLFESEFFGHVRGSFTGAIQDRVGRFELANGGTLFLDEVGEIPPDLQPKLLRVIQEREFERIGEGRTRTVDVRIISAANRELSREAREGRFRLDLYYRLSVFPIEIPPLRERREDIVPLAEHFLRLSARRLGIAVPELGTDQRRALEGYDWPGNVRELQNVIERATILASRGGFRIDVHGPGHASLLPEMLPRDRAAIERALRQARGKVYGTNGAATLLGMKPTTLASKLERLGIRRLEYLHG
jgi:transcriptional regulator with GAF, ATPase, and Fis domain